MTVEWKSLLGTDDPSLNDIEVAKELAQSMNTWALAGYGDGDDEPAPAPKQASAPSERSPAPVTSETLNERYRDAKLETENLKEVLGEAATKHGPESESVRRAQAKLAAAQEAEWGAKQAVSNSVMRDGERMHSGLRARKQVLEEVEKERKDWERSIHQAVGDNDSEAFRMLSARMEERLAGPAEIERRIAERAAQISKRIEDMTRNTMPNSPVGSRPDFDSPRLLEVAQQPTTAQEGFAQFLEKKGDPIGAAEVRAGRLPTKK